MLTYQLNAVYKELNMTESIKELADQCSKARFASRLLSKLSTEDKNKTLRALANNLKLYQDDILTANALDIAIGRDRKLSDVLLDRLLLDNSRLEGIISDIYSVESLSDPIGENFDARTLPNGLKVSRRRVPLGVIGSIYESRPNVTVDIAVLCIKSGNAVVLRGGSESINSNRVLSKVIRQSMKESGVTEEGVQFIDSIDRDLVDAMLGMRGSIDLMIPRGGSDFIRYVGETAQMPVVTGGIGVCHLYVDRSADLSKACNIAFNAKVQRPTVCNALDSILVHSEVASDYLPHIVRDLSNAGVEVRCDDASLLALKDLSSINVKPATEKDWGKEFLSLVISIRVVDSMDEALEHIESHGSGHTEAIITEDHSNAVRFLDEVDAAVVMVNASTRFTDGSELGLGSEVAISTNKMHARGPMGLRELTSYKWTVLGDGHVRQ